MAGVIQGALGEGWNGLAPLVRRHFSLAEAGSPDVVLTGTMDEVSHGGLGRLLFPLLGVIGVLVPYQGHDVPCTVRHRVLRDRLWWERQFHFPGKAPYRFLSCMAPAGPGCCVERVRFGLAILLKVSCDGGALTFEDGGYLWELGGQRVPLRLRWLLGTLRVEERQEGDELLVRLTLRHPWFGRLFLYRGRFVIGH
jgi:hypothetical protein